MASPSRLSLMVLGPCMAMMQEKDDCSKGRCQGPVQLTESGSVCLGPRFVCFKQAPPSNPWCYMLKIISLSDHISIILNSQQSNIFLIGLVRKPRCFMCSYVLKTFFRTYEHIRDPQSKTVNPLLWKKENMSQGKDF